MSHTIPATRQLKSLNPQSARDPLCSYRNVRIFMGTGAYSVRATLVGYRRADGEFVHTREVQRTLLGNLIADIDAHLDARAVEIRKLAIEAKVA